MKVSLSPDIILCGWVGLKHQLTLYCRRVPPLWVGCFSSLRGFWGEDSANHSSPTLWIFIFYYVEISSRTLIPLFTQGSVHIGSSRWDDCGRVFSDDSRVSSFPWEGPNTMPGQRSRSDFVGPRVYACLGVTCHLHFWQNDRGSFTCHCGNKGWNNREQESAQKINSGEKKILPPLLSGIETATCSITDPVLSQQVIPCETSPLPFLSSFPFPPLS